MHLRIVPYASLAPRPWKNGLGFTRELAVHPPRATTESFEWRLSIAELTGSAPFSSFPGVTRSLAMLEGTLRLQWQNGEVQQLHPHSAPLEFAGDAAVSGTVAQGSALDLNLMWQPARWYAAMTRLTGHAGARQLQRFMGTFLVCSLSDHLSLQLVGENYVLGRYDLLWLEASDARLQACASDSFDVYCIELQPR